MILLTLLPIGMMQALESFNNGFWSARSLEFYQQPVVKLLPWVRLAPDTLFIAAGVVPLLAAAICGFLHPKPAVEPKVAVEREEERELAGV